MVHKKSIVVAAAAAAALSMPAVSLAAAPAAQSHSLRVVKVLSKHFVGPLQFDVAAGKVFVADSFTSTLRRIGSTHVIAHGGNPKTGGDLAGVAFDAVHHDLAYLESNGKHTDTEFVLLHRGKRVLSRNLAKWEARHNPDGAIRYGVLHPSSCVRKALTAAHVPVSYRGAVDSHPYAVAYLGSHRWAVADAGGNDVLLINSATGKVATIGVLPRQALKVSKAFAAANHFPSCTVGVTYYTEAVPTDVELGPKGLLYVSTLPGGPEGPGVPARGGVYTISMRGSIHRIGHGFDGATNLAVTGRGTVYVAEISKGAIAVLHQGTPRTVLKLAGVVAVEWKYGELFASTAPAAAGGAGPGMIVKIR